MTKLKAFRYIVPVCLGIMLWTPPCYSFGFPSFDIAEVAGTIKGVVTSAQSYVSTVQSTISQGKELLALGDGLGSIMKFKDEALEAARKATKEAKKLKNLERLKDLRTKIEGGISTVKSKVEETKDQMGGMVDQAKSKVSDVTDKVQDIKGGDKLEGVVALNNTKTTTTEGISPSSVGEINANKVINLSSNSSDRAFSTAGTVSGIASVTAPISQPAAMPTPTPVAKPISQPVAISTPAKVQALSDKTVNTAASLKNPTVDMKNVNIGKDLGKPTINTLPVNKTTPVVSKPKLNAMPSKGARTFKSTQSEINYNTSSKTSFAQLSSFKGGTTDDGRFVFSDIFAAKCNLSFEDAENEDKVKECFKTWVLCMSNPKKEEALACREEYKKAMHEQVAADLAASINDKKYASSFDTDVAEDLQSKATSLTNEREEVSYVGEVNKANQELLLRLMHSMSSRIVQDTLLAIEQIDASHYDED